MVTMKTMAIGLLREFTATSAVFLDDIHHETDEITYVYFVSDPRSNFHFSAATVATAFHRNLSAYAVNN